MTTVNPDFEIQLRHQANFMHALSEYVENKLVNYHDVQPGFQTHQRERCLRDLTAQAENLTVESKVSVMVEVMKNFPNYATYWLYAALGGDKTSNAEKKQLLVELNIESDKQTHDVVYEYLHDRRDKEFLRDITYVADSSGDTRRAFVG